MSKSKRTFFIAGTVLLVVTLGVLIALNAKQVLDAVGVSTEPPVFSFNKAVAPGWWNTENYNNQADKDYNGDEPIEKLPVARMNVFKGTKGDGATACFVMYEYYNYTVDTSALYDKAKPASSADIQVERLDDSQASLNTPDGNKSFVLHNYETSGTGSENSMKGTSYGFIPLNDGYIEISGVCPTGDELSDTISVMSAVSLVK